MTDKASFRNSRQYPGKSLKDIAEQYAITKDLNLKDYLTPEKIRKQIDLRPELNRYVMQLKWRGRTTWLRVFDDMFVWPSETEVAAALKRLLQTKMPKIGFVTGDLERDIDKLGDRDYKALTNLSTFRYSLVNQGFDVEMIELEHQDIPIDIAAMVLADPRLELNSKTMTKLQQYISHGGNLLIAGEPDRQGILNPLLKELGVQINNGMVIQESKDMAPNLAVPDLTPFVGSFSKNIKQKIEDSVKISMPGVAGLRWTKNPGFDIQPLLTTDAKLTWNRLKPINLDLIVKATVTPPNDNACSNIGTVSFNTEDGDEKGPITTAVSLTRKINGRQQRIIVAGDADFMSNGEMARFNLKTANFAFNTALFSWLSYGEFPVDTTRPLSKDKRIKVSLNQVKLLKYFYIWILPCMLLAFGTILLIRRKRK